MAKMLISIKKKFYLFPFEQFQYNYLNIFLRIYLDLSLKLTKNNNFINYI